MGVGTRNSLEGVDTRRFVEVVDSRPPAAGEPNIGWGRSKWSPKVASERNSKTNPITSTRSQDNE